MIGEPVARLCDGFSFVWSYGLGFGIIEELEQKHDTPKINEKELAKIVHMLIKKHCEEEINILDRYKIKPEEILTGVHCPNCTELSMIRNRGGWVCTSCQTRSKTAHYTALEDRLLLLGPHITHQQFKEFLGLESDSITSNIISSLGLNHCESKYKRTYTLSTHTQKQKQPHKGAAST
jgi:ribosomal protein L37AE/L43A